jgi:hypothetical protein
MSYGQALRWMKHSNSAPHPPMTRVSCFTLGVFFEANPHIDIASAELIVRIHSAPAESLQSSVPLLNAYLWVARRLRVLDFRSAVGLIRKRDKP